MAWGSSSFRAFGQRFILYARLLAAFGSPGAALGA